MSGDLYENISVALRLGPYFRDHTELPAPSFYNLKVRATPGTFTFATSFSNTRPTNIIYAQVTMRDEHVVYH